MKRTSFLSKSITISFLIIVALIMMFCLTLSSFKNDVAYAADKGWGENYDYVTNQKYDYIADGDVSKVQPPIWQPQEDYKAILIPNTNLSGNLNLKNFGIADEAGINNNDALRDINILSYNSGRCASGSGHSHWKYMYGYIELPKNLSLNGGKLTVSAKQSSYAVKTKGANMEQAPDGRYTYFTVVAGDELRNNKTTELQTNDIKINKVTGKNRSYYVDATTSASFAPAKDVSVTIDVRPGDKYARISYTLFMKKGSGVHYNTFGQKIQDIKVSYEENPSMEAVEVNEKPNYSIKATAPTALSATITGGDLNNVAMTKEGDVFTYPITKDAEYMVKTMYSNNTFNIRRVKGDPVAPVLNVTGLDTPALNTLTAKVNIVESNLQTLTLDDQDVKSQLDTQNNLNVTFTDIKAKTLTAIDKNGNTTTIELKPTHLLLAQINDNFVIDATNIASNKITVTMKATEGHKVVTPQGVWKGATATKIYNYGVEGKYDVTFDPSINYSQVLSLTTDAVKVNITVAIDGKEVNNSYDWKSAQSIIVPEIAGKEFIGIYNDKNVLIATVEDLAVSAGNIGEYNYIVTTPATFNVKYAEVAKQTLITYKNLSGRIINKVLIDGKFDKNANKHLAPAMPYMTFDYWILKEGNVAVPHYTYNSATVFNVTVDGVKVENAYFNKRIDLTGSEFGWAVDGKIITTKSNYSLYVTNDMVITKVQDSQALSTVKSVKVSKDNDTFVINGLLEDGAKYKEVGFIFASTTLDNNYFNIENTSYVTKYPVYTITENSNQFVLAVKNLQNCKVRMYTIDEEGNITYSTDIVELV